MTIEKTTLSSPTEGWVAAPFSTPNLGEYDQLRNQSAIYPGQAVSFKASLDPADFLDVYLYGDPLARPEFGGVCITSSNSPGNQNPVCTDNSNGISILKVGRAAVMLAPGEVIERDQYLEVIPSGAYQGCFRAASSPGSAVAQSMQPKDDSDNEDGALPGALITAMILERPASSGLVGGRALGPSDTLTGVTTETAYVYTVGTTHPVMQRTIPANSAKVGDRYRVVFAGQALTGASGATIFKAYAGGAIAGTGKFWQSISTTPAQGDVFQVIAELYINALTGSNNVSLSGAAIVGTPGAATARSLGIACTMDLTVDNQIYVTDTPNNIADQSQLTFLSLEKVA
jgi:hypothetical protein